MGHCSAGEGDPKTFKTETSEEQVMITNHIIVEGLKDRMGGSVDYGDHVLKMELFSLACDLGPVGWVEFSRRVSDRCEKMTPIGSSSAAIASANIVRLAADDIALRVEMLALDGLGDVIESLHTCSNYAIRCASAIDYYASRTGGVEQEIAEQFHDLELILQEQTEH